MRRDGLIVGMSSRYRYSWRCSTAMSGLPRQIGGSPRRLCGIQAAIRKVFRASTAKNLRAELYEKIMRTVENQIKKAVKRRSSPQGRKSGRGEWI